MSKLTPGDIAKGCCRLGCRCSKAKSSQEKQPGGQCGGRGTQVTGQGDMGDLTFPMETVHSGQEVQRGKHESG